MIFQRSPNNRVINVVKLCGLVTWCLLSGLWVGSRPVQAADTVVGTGTAVSCTEGAFDTALATVQNSGGGISNSGALTVSTSLLSSNSANQGGGIFNQNLATLISSTLSGNISNQDGGGIYNTDALTVSNSMLSGNLATQPGGGIFNQYFSRLTVISSTLSGNTASQNGGGITNSGALTVSRSTLSSNLAQSGGGVYNDIPNNFGRLTVSNSTLSSNSASQNGGGLFNTERNNSTLHIDSSTVADNSANAGGGVYNSSSPITISNSIIANSPKGGDCAGTIINGGHNLIEDNSCDFSGGSDPRLGPLQDNGGPTFTHALLAGSPAIDTGASTLATDQRGVIRPQGSAVDIGAFELERQMGAATIYLPVNCKQ